MANCVRPDAIASISKVACAVHFYQMCALLLQRAQDTPSFANEAAMKTLAAWSALLTADDGTKIVKTPEFAGFQIPGSEPQYAEQNTNNSIDGLGYFTGFNSVQAKGQFIGLPSDIRTQLATYQEESAAGLDPGMTAYILLNDGRIVYQKDPTSSAIGGIPFTNFYMASLKLDGFKANNTNDFGLSLPGDWDKNLQVLTPSFNARLKLAA
ncbi:hypothetical protein HHL22_20635 [Hymenobacter sp. RP-2-7]|uniref:Uncharacterized protein n=1 Tax=Hymenobacter polaris TaxID=2682546 RepID=A0A7Y0AHW7_9BACT|nr:hypothetical protein [Hymenobacter polaris]NML67615.1 hypothetical protein [Hymenobacter polaris]